MLLCVYYQEKREKNKKKKKKKKEKKKKRSLMLCEGNAKNCLHSLALEISLELVTELCPDSMTRHAGETVLRAYFHNFPLSHPL